MLNLDATETMEEAAERWRQAAAERHNGLHYDLHPSLWHYFQMVRNHMFTRDYVPDVVQETIEPDVYKTLPLYTLPMLQQARRMVELGCAFSFYPVRYDPPNDPWKRSPEPLEGVLSTRILLGVCKLLHDFAGVDATLTSIDIRDGKGSDGGVPWDIQERSVNLFRDMGLLDYWRPQVGTDAGPWLAAEAGLIERGEALPVDFMLVDSNHTYEQVKAELEGTHALMAPRGLILVDDCYSTDYRHGDTWTPEESEYGLRRGGEYGAIIEFAEAYGWRIEWLQYMALLRRD